MMNRRTMSLLLSIVLVMMLLPATAVYADEVDTVYSFSGLNVGYIYFTETRAKDSTRGLYVYYVTGRNQPNGTYYSAWSGGANYSRDGSGIIWPGQKRRIYNYIYEVGNRTCYLGVSPHTYYSPLIQGIWSPDAVDPVPYCN